MQPERNIVHRMLQKEMLFKKNPFRQKCVRNGFLNFEIFRRKPFSVDVALFRWAFHKTIKIIMFTSKVPSYKPFFATHKVIGCVEW